MTFLTQLNKTGQAQMQALIDSIILEGIKRPGVFVSQVPKAPSESDHILFRSFWIQRGPLEVPSEEELASYVLTYLYSR
jgi:midasin (ATPase involved in ribosome maturation)